MRVKGKGYGIYVLYVYLCIGGFDEDGTVRGRQSKRLFGVAVCAKWYAK